MAELIRHITNRGVPLTAPSRPPEITIWRLDTYVEAVSDQVMSHLGRGNWRLAFAQDPINYWFTIDADPAGSGQVSKTERYYSGPLSGLAIQQVEVGIPAVPKAVFDYDLSGYTAGLFLAGEAINATRQFISGHIDASPGDPGLMIWYDDLNQVRFHQQLRDSTGGAVLAVPGVPALKGRVFVPPP